MRLEVKMLAKLAGDQHPADSRDLTVAFPEPQLIVGKEI